MQTTGRERILIVDDEDSIIDIAREVLERQGYHVFASGNGREALAVYREAIPPIDLVILDLNLPDMNGEDVLDCMKDINPLVRVILSSGYRRLTEKTYAMDGKDPHHFLQKPFRITELIAKVRDTLAEE